MSTLAGADGTAVSRLLIHTAGDEGRDGRRAESIIHRMCAHVLDGTRSERAALALEIQNLEGHRVLGLDDAGPLVEVALPPGTYHVITDFAGTRRRYTVALMPGTSLDLHLCPARDRR